MYFLCFREEFSPFIGGSGRAAPAVGARAQFLRGAYHALRHRALALHHGRLRLQGLHAKGHPPQTSWRAQPHRALRPPSC